MRAWARPPALVAAVWLALGGCGAAHNEGGLGLTPLPPYDPPPYMLLIMSRPSGSSPVPAGFDAAEAAVARARAAYERHAYREAADLFMEAARALRLPPGEHYAEAFEVNRTWAYTNATYAFGMANALDEGRRRLEEAAASDPACAPELRKLIAQLPSLVRSP